MCLSEAYTPQYVFSSLPNLKTVDNHDINDKIVQETIDLYDDSLTKFLQDDDSVQQSRSIKSSPQKHQYSHIPQSQQHRQSPLKKSQSKENTDPDQQIDKLENYMAKLYTIVAEQESRINSHQQLIDPTPPKDNSQLINNLLQLTTENTRLQGTIEKSVSEEKKATSRIKTLEDALLTEKKHLNKFKSLKQQMDVKIDTLEREIVAKMDDLKTQSELLHNNNEKTLHMKCHFEKTLDSLNAKLSDCQIKLQTSEAATTSKNEEIAALRIQCDTFKELVDQLTGKYEALQLQYNNAQDSMNEIRVKYSNEYAAQQKQIDSLTSQGQKTKQELGEQINQTTSLKMTLAKLSAKNEALQCENNRFSTTAQQTKEENDKKVFILKCELENSKKESEDVKLAYNNLEEEFIRTCEEERKKTKTIESAYYEIEDELMVMKRKIEAFSEQREEAELVIHDLNNCVKEQKQKIESITEKNANTKRALQDSLKKIDAYERCREKYKSEIQKMAKDIKALKSSLIECGKREESDVKYKFTLEQKIKEQAESLEREATMLKTALQVEKDARTKDVEILSGLETALKVKTVMLEDQNETIKILKQNLENKAREHQTIAASETGREKEILNHIDIIDRENEDMRRKLSCREEEIEYLDQQYHSIKSEKEFLQKEIIELSAKLQERSEKFAMIEAEVSKVTSQFQAKESKLIKEKEEIIIRKEVIIDELETRLHTQTTKFASWNKEREALIQSVRRLQKELNIERSQIVELKKEAEKQKLIANEKLAKIKAAFTEIS